MKNYKLSFGRILVLKKSLAEVIVNDGVVMNEFMIEEYHNFLREKLQAPFSLLINKKYSYTYTFKAQKNIADLKEIKAMAVVYGTNGGLMSTETLINLNKSKNWNIKLFRTRIDALTWLNMQ